ncbi:MAG: hypothetical protein MI924_33450 [Chloroflexales bacterium]|nr:hypothetical protein [Chloroflexales bacterium]
MSILDPNKLRHELLLEEAINAQLDKLVGYATRTALLLDGNTKMKTSQLRNLLNVALDPASVEVVINFIRYQIAREGNAWNPKNFGHAVIDDIRGPVQQLVSTSISKARELEGQHLSSQVIDFDAQSYAIYVRLIQLYLGYLQRVFYAYDKAKSEQKKEAVVQMQAIVDTVFPKTGEGNNG